MPKRDGEDTRIQTHTHTHTRTHIQRGELQLVYNPKEKEK